MPYIDAMGFWNDTPAYMVVRLNAFFSLFSLGNYYINSLFFNFISFTGIIFLYRFFKSDHSSPPFWLFFIPSVLFWFSGAHKDALVLTGVGILVFGLKCAITSTRWKGLFLVLLGSMITYLIRDYLILLMLPGLIAFVWVNYSPSRIILKYLTVYLSSFIAASFIQVPDSELTFIDLFKHKQLQFLSLFPGDSQIVPPTLNYGWWSLIKAIPSGLLNSCFRPHAFEIDGVLQVASLLELMGIYLLFLYAVWKQKTNTILSSPTAILSILFFTSIMIMVGVVVPNIGAICRYRALAWPFLLTPLFTNKQSST